MSRFSLVLSDILEPAQYTGILAKRMSKKGGCEGGRLHVPVKV